MRDFLALGERVRVQAHQMARVLGGSVAGAQCRTPSKATATHAGDGLNGGCGEP